MTPHKRISEFLYGSGKSDDEVELTHAIATVEIEDRIRGLASGIHEAKKRFPVAVANGVLQRVLEGRNLPHRTIDLMAGAGFALEDEAVLAIALSEKELHHRADAAASVLGPGSIGHLIDQMSDLDEQMREREAYDEALPARHRKIRRRIQHTQVRHLLTAIKERSEHASNRQISGFAHLIGGHWQRVDADGQVFDADAQAQIAEFVEEWGNRLLGSLGSRIRIASRTRSAPRQTLRGIRVCRLRTHSTSNRTTAGPRFVESPRTMPQGPTHWLERPTRSARNGEALSVANAGIRWP